VLETVHRGVSSGEEVSLALMYEGVLVPGLDSSEPLCPDPELLELLRMLRTRSRISVHLLSSVSREVLDRWFDPVPATLWAEHGLWRRERDGHRWRRTQWITTGWTEDVRALLNQFAARTPGAFVEERGSSLLWHFARAERIEAHTQAQMLSALLREAGDTLGFIVTKTDHVIEVRPEGLTIERTLQRVLDSRPSRGPVVIFLPCALALGPQALNNNGPIVTIGESRANGDVSLPDARAVRTLLWNLAASLPAAADADSGLSTRRRTGPMDHDRRTPLHALTP
jgi:trehalose 6-phosphate synthase/phosphatase